jgi:hypothetical protein
MIVGCLLGLAAVAAAMDRPATALSISPGASGSATIAAADRPRLLSVVVAIDRPGHLSPGVPIEVSLAVGPSSLKKELHLGDPDVAWTIRPEAASTPR